MSRRVVITGMGLVTPLANGREASWKKLVAGESGLKTVDLFDTSDLACKIGGDLVRHCRPVVGGSARTHDGNGVFRFHVLWTGNSSHPHHPRATSLKVVERIGPHFITGNDHVRSALL